MDTRQDGHFEVILCEIVIQAQEDEKEMFHEPVNTKAELLESSESELKHQAEP